MLRDKKTKIASLVLTVATLVMVYVPFEPMAVGLTDGCTMLSPQRLVYHFFHAGFFHWLFNAWSFLSCVFLARVRWRDVVAAYVCACTAPTVGTLPTVGFSGVCFALLGMVMWQSGDKRTYNIIMCATILATWAVLPHAVAGLLHLYCYAAGAAYGAACLYLKRRRNEER